jgi:hypothetical protein
VRRHNTLASLWALVIQNDVCSMLTPSQSLANHHRMTFAVQVSFPTFQVFGWMSARMSTQNSSAPSTLPVVIPCVGAFLYGLG